MITPSSIILLVETQKNIEITLVQVYDLDIYYVSSFTLLNFHVVEWDLQQKDIWVGSSLFPARLHNSVDVEPSTSQCFKFRGQKMILVLWRHGPVRFAEQTSRNTVQPDLSWEKNTAPAEKTSWKVRIIRQANRASPDENGTAYWRTLHSLLSTICVAKLLVFLLRTKKWLHRLRKTGSIERLEMAYTNQRLHHICWCFV